MRQETRLFVGNLPHDVDEESLRSRFSLYGDIKHLELKSKNEAEAKKFAFITLLTNERNVDSCIKHFAAKGYVSDNIYVTRARESFLERLQRERQEGLEKAEKTRVETVSNMHQHVGNKKMDNFRSGSPNIVKKRKSEQNGIEHNKPKGKKRDSPVKAVVEDIPTKPTAPEKVNSKKEESNKKRLDSMKKKSQEFKEKKKIIKTGLFGIDLAPNKKIVFNDLDDEEMPPLEHDNGYSEFEDLPKHTPSRNLFEDDESDQEINFEIRKQFEGKQGQKVLELQSKYKSDKRFVLDERFRDDELGETLNDEGDDDIETSQLNEKDKQLNILQDVLGVSLSSGRKPVDSDNKKKNKTKFGMLRFDPLQPEHSKFLAPVEEKKQEQIKTKKKKKGQMEEDIANDPVEEIEKVEVSKEQFYRVSETLKEALVQDNSFSLRSLFKNDVDVEKDQDDNKDQDFIPINKQKEPKVKNPLDNGEANPFKYDSSDSEDNELPDKNKDESTPLDSITGTKAIWKENLFFTANDQRLLDGLSFFNMKPDSEGRKDRRELKNLMKKRINNKNRKDQMFKKKIGGRRQSRRTFRKK